MKPMGWRVWLGTFLVFAAVSFIVRQFQKPPTPTMRYDGFAAQTPAAAPTAPTPPTPPASRASTGETTTVRKAKGFWPCGSTPEAYDELMKWAGLGDNTEVKYTLVKTRSIGIDGGMRVKILDIAFGKRRVRVLTDDAGAVTVKDEKGVSLLADSRIGRECWVTADA